MVPIGTYESMTYHHDILAELDEYARRADTTPPSVCRRATGNPRMFERLKRRLERTDEDIARLREFMEANPPASEAPQAEGRA
jgi:ferritin-like metal-binding protein YciE